MKIRLMADGITTKHQQMNKAIKKIIPDGDTTNDVMVITVSGKSVPKSQCRLIGKLFYQIGNLKVKNSGDCYLIGDTYYKRDGNKLIWNQTRGQYEVISDRVVKGLIEPKEIGYFEPDIRENVSIRWNDENMRAISEDVAIKSGLIYDHTKGTFASKFEISQAATQPMVMSRKPSYSSFSGEIYSLSDNPAVKTVLAVFKPLPKHSLDRFFHNFTIGLEIETDGGWLPENYYYKFGALPLKDGSIKGTEITTLPYGEDDGITNAIWRLMVKCSKYTLATQNNSLHVNVGNVSKDPKFPIALYILYYRLQQEIESWIPAYKRDLAYLTSKQGGPKDHCKTMPHLPFVKKYVPATLDADIKQANKDLFTFLNEGIWDSDHNLTTRRHRRTGDQKWNYHMRYYALNLIPYYFGNEKHQRVEWRLHSGTVNPIKTMIWTMICCAITKFAEENTDRILAGREKITLDDVIGTMFNDGGEHSQFLTDYITAYIASRRDENFRNISAHDTYGKEFVTDRNYDFKFQSKSLLSLFHE